MADTYQVSGQRQTNRLSPAGQWEEVMEVSFRVTDSNMTGVIDVPLYEYSADVVHERIAARVAAMLAVQNL